MESNNKSLKLSKSAAARLKLDNGESELQHFFAGEKSESKKINIHQQRPETQA